MTIQQADAPINLRERRARALDRMLEAERWTNRKAASALGLTHTYVGRRRNGELDLTFADVEMFAGLLRLTPEQLFAELRAAAFDPAPVNAEGRSEERPSTDVPPTGVEPATYGTNVRRLVPRTAARTVAGPERIAPVTSIADRVSTKHAS